MEIKENGFYLITDEFISLIHSKGGEFKDSKSRPMFCCFKDGIVDGLYWIIPTSDLSHRTYEQIQKYKKYDSQHGIRSAYYYIGNTNKPALFKISKVLPITQKYFLREYCDYGKPLVLRDTKQIEQIRGKLLRILAYENAFPNKLEQHISELKCFLCEELKNEQQTITT